MQTLQATPPPPPVPGSSNRSTRFLVAATTNLVIRIGVAWNSDSGVPPRVDTSTISARGKTGRYQEITKPRSVLAACQVHPDGALIDRTDRCLSGDDKVEGPSWAITSLESPDVVEAERLRGFARGNPGGPEANSPR
jgi:hypothetical protein